MKLHLNVANAALCLTLMAFSVSPADALVIGAPGDAGTGNCMPFGCGAGYWGTEYQQVYAASDFSGPINITSLSFYHNNFSGDAGALDTGTFKIYLSTTSAAVDGLNGTLANNLGADNTLVYSGPLPSSVSFGSFFDIFVSAFDYNPVNGNLLLDVQSSDYSGGPAYLDALNGDANGLFSRITNGGNSGTSGWGLVTGFNETQAVPEPITLSLFGAGLAGAVAMRRRKNK